MESNNAPMQNKNRLKMIIGVVLCAALVLGTLAMVFSNIGGSVYGAWNNTLAAAEKSFSQMGEATGYNRFAKPLLDADYALTGEFTLEELLSKSLFALMAKGSQFSFDYQFSRSEKNASLQAAARIARIFSLKTQLYYDENAINFSAPSFSNKVVQLKNEDVYGQLQDIGIFKDLDLPDSGGKFSFKTVTPMDVVDGFVHAKQNQLMGLLYKISMGEVEKQSREAFGATMDCQTYKITIPPDVIGEFLDCVIDFMERDLAFKEVLEIYAIDGDEAVGELKKVRDELRKSMTENLVVFVYIAKGFVVGVSAEHAFKNFHLDIALKGSGNIFDDYTMALRYGTHAYVLSGGSAANGDKTEMNISLQDGQKELLSLAMRFDRRSGEFAAEYRRSHKEKAQGIRASAILSASKGNFNADELSLVLEKGAGENAASYAFRGKLSLSKFTGTSKAEGKIVPVRDFGFDDVFGDILGLWKEKTD